MNIYVFQKRTKFVLLAFLLLYITIYFSFLLHLQHMMLVNMKLDISGCNRITFQGYRLHWMLSEVCEKPQ